MANKISFFDALKHTFSFIFLSNGNKPTDDDILDDADNNDIECPRCKGVMVVVNQLIGEFLTMIIYRCPICGLTKEIQFNQETGEIMKDVTLYDRFAHSSSTYMEILNECKYNEFALDRLWEIGGVPCYPILLKTHLSDDIDLVFIKLNDDLNNNSVNGFILTDNGMIGQVKINKSDGYSYFLNPYLYKIPHTTFNYVSSPTPINNNVFTISPIRYRFKTSHLKNSYLYEFSIIEDFPVQSYGIEVFVKFAAFDNFSQTPISKVIQMIDLKHIICCPETNPDPGSEIYIQEMRTSKINLFSTTSRNISKDLREHFYSSIVKFFKLIE